MKLIRFICKYCHEEVEGEIYKSMNMIGDYAECPECGAENEIKNDNIATKETDDFNWEDEEDALAET